MKRIISVLLAVLMLFSFAACKNKITPEKTLDAMLVALKNGDLETLAEMNGDEIEDVYEMEMMENIFSELSWTFGETVAEDDDAKVGLKVTATDMQVVFTEYITQAFSQAMQGVEMTDEAAEQLLLDVLNETEETKTFDVVVDMSFVDGKWIVDDGNDDFYDAITGGLMSAAKDFS